MKYGSVCSGIEAASVAWHPLGWKASFLSEIEPFPRSVLAHHYPEVPLHGDFTTIQKGDYEPIELLVGGTPCQSFSVAGLRAGLDDPRGNLMLEFGALARRLCPKWLVWENVPGVLSSNGGRDFGTFLGLLGILGYGFAYRVLDAQYFGVPQRRRRVFVVGYFGDWRPAAAVLFERHSLSGHLAPSRKTGEAVAGTIAKCSFSGGAGGRPEGAAGNHFIAETAPTLDAHYGDKMGLDNQHINSGGGCSLPRLAMCLNAGAMGRQDAESETLIPVNGGGFDVAPTLTSNGDAHSGFKDERGLVTCYGIPGNWIGRKPENGGNAVEPMLDISPCQTKTDRHAIAWSEELTASTDCAGTIQRGGAGGRHDGFMTKSMQVRRLTPRECERLQGFPDDYTNVPHKGKPAADGPRYKALGNSMAVPVMRWIGERIEMVSKIQKIDAAA